MHRIFIVTGFLFLLSGCYKKQESPTIEKLPLAQRIEERFSQEFAKTMDPHTQNVPSDRLVKAKKAIREKYRTKTAIPNIDWEERGPNNVSGRTRSIMLDSRDASGNTIFAGGVAGGIWKSTNGGVSWTIINDFYNNLAVTSIVQDPNNPSIIYFGTGENWAFGQGLRGEGIYKSTDGGVSFTVLASTNGNKDFEYINRLAIQSYNGSTVLYAATASSDNSKGGLLISQDGGNNWLIWKGNNSGINNFASDVKLTAPDPFNNNQTVVMAAFGGGNNFTDTESDGLWFSANGGTTWQRYYTADPNEGRIEIATAPSDPYIVYIICESKNPNLPPSMHGTALVGNQYTWVPITPPLQGVIDNNNCNPTAVDITRGQDFYDLAIAVAPDNPYRLLVGGVDLWIYQRNPFIFSDSWQQISNWGGFCNLPKVHADQHVILFEDNNEVYVANDGGIWKSDNANSNFPTFSFRGNSLNITQFYCADSHPSAGSNIYLAGAQDNGSQHYQTPGINITNEVTGGDGMFCHIDQLNGTTQIASYIHQNFYVTQDNWQTISQGSNGTKGRFVNPSDYDDVNKKLYAADATGTFFRWNDPATSGTSTSIVSVSGFPNNLTDNLVWSIRVSPNISGRAYFGFDGGLVVRTDNTHNASSIIGQRIFDLGLGPGHVVSCIEIEKGNEDHMLITLSNYGITSVYESNNATAQSPTWTAVEGNLPDMPVRWAMFNPNNSDQAFLATELGVWSTTNINGSSTDWDPTNLGLSNTRIDMIKYRASDLEMVVATFGRGLFTSDALSGSCVQNHSLNGITVSGAYSASSAITVQNSTVASSAALNAPSVTMSNQFTVNGGATLTVDSEGCK